MQQSGVGKHHGRARGDATAVRRHRSARRLALPAYPSGSCFDSHLAPSERSLASSERYYVHSTMLAANKQETPPGYLGSGAVGRGRGLARPLSASREDQGSGSDLGTRLLRTFIRPQKPSFSSRFSAFSFSQVRDWATRHLAERSRQVPRQGTVQGGLCSTLHIVRVQKVRGV